jgi:hypothetical protein
MQDLVDIRRRRSTVVDGCTAAEGKSIVRIIEGVQALAVHTSCGPECECCFESKF